MSKREEKSLTDKRKAILSYKKEVYKVRITTYLQSQTKNKFLNDCINKKCSTSSQIIKINNKNKIL